MNKNQILGENVFIYSMAYWISHDHLKNSTYVYK